MVKVCTVNNFVSGCKAERNKKKQLNLRQTALFKVPKVRDITSLSLVVDNIQNGMKSIEY